MYVQTSPFQHATYLLTNNGLLGPGLNAFLASPGEGRGGPALDDVAGQAGLKDGSLMLSPAPNVESAGRDAAHERVSVDAGGEDRDDGAQEQMKAHAVMRAQAEEKIKMPAISGCETSYA